MWFGREVPKYQLNWLRPSSRKWSMQVAAECYLSTKLHGVTAHKTDIESQCRHNHECAFFLGGVILSTVYRKYSIHLPVFTSGIYDLFMLCA
jgi:hypothetical protein